MSSFYLNFFIFSKKKLLRNIRSCSEYLTLFTVYRMFTLCNLVSTIMKARAYRMYKILTGSRDDSSSWSKDIFCKIYIVSLCPGVSLCPRLRYSVFFVANLYLDPRRNLIILCLRSFLFPFSFYVLPTLVGCRAMFPFYNVSLENVFRGTKKVNVNQRWLTHFQPIFQLWINQVVGFY